MIIAQTIKDKENRIFSLRRNSLIGKGSYGQVHKTHFNNCDIAIKTFVNVNGWEKIPLREFTAYCSISPHPNILKCYFARFENNNLQIISPLCKYTLLTHLQVATIKTCDILMWTYQLIDAINHMHLNGYAHRDIKLENILLDENNNIVVCDLGMCRQLNDSHSDNNFSSHVCTLWTKAPELLKKSKTYGLEIDSWSIGCVLWALAAGHYVLRNTDDHSINHMIEKLLNCDKQEKIKHIEKICKRSDLPINFYELVSDLLEIDPKKRTSLDKAKLHCLHWHKLIVCNEDNIEWKGDFIFPKLLKWDNKIALNEYSKWIQSTLENLKLGPHTILHSLICFSRVKKDSLVYAASCCSLISKLIDHIEIKQSTWSKLGGCKVKEFIETEKKVVCILGGNLLTNFNTLKSAKELLQELCP